MTEHRITAARGVMCGTRTNARALRRAFMAVALVMTLTTAAHALRVHVDDHALPVNDNPQGLAAVDCNGDGISELISANFDSDTATVFANAGAGTLLHDRNIATGPQPSGATCADFDNDGRIDAAVTSWTNRSVTLYLRGEDGSFVAGGTFPVGNLPRSVSAGDLNLDGNADLVVVNVQSSDLTLLFGDGTGGIASTVNIRIPRLSAQASQPVSAQIADFNRDGLPDIVVAASQRDPSLHLLLGDGFGFQFSPKPLPATGSLRYVAAGDVDGDGIPDLVTLGVDTAIKLFTGVGDGTFVPAKLLRGDEEAKAIALADFDGDGMTDLAVASAESNSVRILRAVTPGSFRALPTVAAPAIVAPMVSARQRETATGQHQVVFVDSTHDVVSMLQLVELAAPAIFPLATVPRALGSLLLVDLTRDGVPDAVVPATGHKRSVAVTFLRGNLAGGFDPFEGSRGVCGNAVLEPGESCDDGNLKKADGCSEACAVSVAALQSIDSADFDRDGNQDLVVVDAKGDLRLLLGNGRGQFSAIRPLGRLRRKTGAAVGDFNGDGNPDLAFVPRSRNAGSIHLLINDGGASFTPLVIVTPAKLGGPVIAGDFDHNGYDDVLAVQTSKPKGLALLMSDAAAPLRVSQSSPTPVGVESLKAADFDEDGHLDVVVEYRGKKQPPTLLLGALGGRFRAAPPLPLDAAGAAYAIADVDEDLHQDLLSCTAPVAPTCRVLYGSGEGTFSASRIPTAPTIGRDVRGAVADDFDGDGSVDVAGVSREDDQMVVHFGGADAVSLVLETGRSPEALALGDFNGDGRNDLVAANAGSQDLSIFINHGNRTFVSVARTKLPAGNGHVAIAVGDVDGDSKLDVAVVQSDSNRLTLYRNMGAAGFAVTAHLTTGTEPRGVAIGEINGDGVADVAVANRGADTVSVFASAPDGSYVRTNLAAQGFWPWGVALPDLNGDGLADLVVVNELAKDPATSPPSTDSREGNLVTFLNHAADGFTVPLPPHVRGRQTPVAMCVGDFNGDALWDIAVGSVTTRDVMLLHGRGDGTWSDDERDFPVGHPVAALSCHDADRDGRDDIAFARRRANDVGVILTSSDQSH